MEPAVGTPQHEWMGCSTLSFKPPISDYHGQLSSRILISFTERGPAGLLKKITENEQEQPPRDKQDGTVVQMTLQKSQLADEALAQFCESELDGKMPKGHQKGKFMATNLLSESRLEGDIDVHTMESHKGR